jgi:hypothetical protein
LLCTPLLNSAYQVTANPLSTKSLIDNKTSNLHPIVALQILSERSLNPANQLGLGVGLSNENYIAEAFEQTL